MKLLLFTSSLGSGGAERQLVNLAILFKERGFEVQFVVYHTADFYKHYLIKNNIPLTVLQEKNKLDRVFKVRKFIRQSEANVVISFLEVSNFLACMSAIGGKRWKLITNERSAKQSTFVSKRGRFFAKFQRYSDLIVCNSYNAKDLWTKYYPKYAEKLSVVYNPVLLPPVRSEYVPRRNGKLNVIVAASYQYLKNPIGLIKALALLEQSHRKLIRIDWYGRKEVSVGNTRAYNDSVDLIKQFNLHDVIFLHNESKDITEKMNSADIVALFSFVEGLPNAVCEGMTLGKPIMMSRVSDYKVLVDESNGFLVNADNPQSIKEALLKALSLNDESLLKLGNVSKARAGSLFSSENIVSQWVECFER